MTKIISLCLVIVGLINFLPVVGLLGASRLESTYNISLVSIDLITLMRHRALLFGLLGGFILYAAFVRKYQTVAMVMAGISMVGFVGLAHIADSNNPAIMKVLIADYVGIFFLSITVFLKYISGRS